MKRIVIEAVTTHGEQVHLTYGGSGMVVDPAFDWDALSEQLFSEDSLIALLMAATKGKKLQGKAIVFDLTAQDGAIVRIT